MRLWIDWLANLISSSILIGSFKETSACWNIINTCIYYQVYCKYPLGIDRDIDRDSIEDEISTREISTKTVTTWRTKKLFNELVEKRSSEIQNLKKKWILIIWYISTKLKEEVRKNLVIIKIW